MRKKYGRINPVIIAILIALVAAAGSFVYFNSQSVTVFIVKPDIAEIEAGTQLTSDIISQAIIDKQVSKDLIEQGEMITSFDQIRDGFLVDTVKGSTILRKNHISDGKDILNSEYLKKQNLEAVTLTIGQDLMMVSPENLQKDIRLNLYSLLRYDMEMPTAKLPAEVEKILKANGYDGSMGAPVKGYTTSKLQLQNIPVMDVQGDKVTLGFTTQQVETIFNMINNGRIGATIISHDPNAPYVPKTTKGSLSITIINEQSVTQNIPKADGNKEE